MFGSNRDGVLGAYAVNADGTGEVERLFVDEDATVYVGPEDWSPDGTKLVFIGFYPDGRFFDIGMLSVSGERRAELLVEAASVEYLPRVSTNGRWFAYTSTRTGREDVYAERFPELGDRQPISPEGGHQPEWSPDGTELFYVTLDGVRLMSVPVDERAGKGGRDVGRGDS